jgi:hypothetical protein
MAIQIDGDSGISGVNGSATTPALQGTDSNTGIVFGTDEVQIATGGSTRATVDSSGNVGIGTSSPSALLHLSKTTNSGDVGLIIQNTGTSNNTASVYLNKGSGGEPDHRIQNDTGGNLTFARGTDESSYTEQMRLDSSGRLLIGTTAAREHLNDGSDSAQVFIQGTTQNTSTLAVIRSSDNDGPAHIVLGKARGTGSGSTTVVQSGDTVGHINFEAADGSHLIRAAQISCIVDGTPGANDMPGRLSFKTCPDGSNSLTERMRIQKDGTFTNMLGVYNDTTGGSANVNVNSSGSLMRSTSSAKYKTSIETLEDSYADALLNCRPVWYRSLCSQDNPAHGFWGFIAEEVAEIDPRLVHWKTTNVTYDENGDAVETPCDPEAEGVFYDRFVPHLVNIVKRQKATISAQQAQIDDLLARVTALEAA